MSLNHCLVCQQKQWTIYWHETDDGSIWPFCSGVCQKGWPSIDTYLAEAGVSMDMWEAFNEPGASFACTSTTQNEITYHEWPTDRFLLLSDPRAKPAEDYLKSRKIQLDGSLYYDVVSNGIVLPYYVGDRFCGAQIRLIKPTKNKIISLPNTTKGMLFGLWNQEKFNTNIKAVILCEGTFDALSLQQALNLKYGGVINNPFKAIATGGSGVTKYQEDKLKALIANNIKVICAFDNDAAGQEGLEKLSKSRSITHSCSTNEKKDWNDILKRDGGSALASLFIKNVQPIKG